MTGIDIMTVPEPDPEQFFGPVESSLDGLRRSYVFLEALDMGIFSSLAEGKDIGEIARDLGLEAVMAGLFCDTLCDMGLLERRGERYANTPAASAYLVRSSPYYQGRSFDHLRRDLPRWQSLGEVLRSGPLIMKRDEFFNERWICAIAERSLCGGVQRVASQVSEAIRPEQWGRMLDLGGGHGLYAIAFCAIHPTLEAVVFDRPEIVPVTARYIERFGATRVATMAGDYTTDDIGSGYDMLFSSFTGIGAEPRMIPKLTSALVPGGHLIIRSHQEHVREDALGNLGWNFFTVEGGKGGRRRFSDPGMVSPARYREELTDHGLEVLRHWEPDKFSEITIARRVRG